MGRALALPTKRFSLQDLGEGWQDCFISYRPMTAGSLLELADLDTDSAGLDSTKTVLRIAKERVTGGKVLDDDFTIVDMFADDLDELPLEILSDFFAAMTGGTLDPKDISKAAPLGNAPQNSTISTDSSSSTDSLVPDQQ